MTTGSKNVDGVYLIHNLISLYQTGQKALAVAKKWNLPGIYMGQVQPWIDALVQFKNTCKLGLDK